MTVVDVDADTSPGIGAIERRIERLEREQLRAREAQDALQRDLKAVLVGLGTLNTRIDATLRLVEARGWTAWPVRLVTAAALAIAAAELGARAGWW
jgi:hypothetical protein